jgi:uncharacterized protein YozE (UPF0346 family)
MNQALYEHMNNKRKMKKKSAIDLHKFLTNKIFKSEQSPKANLSYKLISNHPLCGK